MARVLRRRKRRDSRGILDREKRRETKSGGWGFALAFGLWVWGLEINQLLIKAIDFFILFIF